MTQHDSREQRNTASAAVAHHRARGEQMRQVVYKTTYPIKAKMKAA